MMAAWIRLLKKKSELKRADSNATNACQAACCIYSLVSCSPTARRVLANCGGVNALHEALQYGEGAHALLESETKRCLQVLEA